MFQKVRVTGALLAGAVEAEEVSTDHVEDALPRTWQDGLQVGVETFLVRISLFP